MTSSRRFRFRFGLRRVETVPATAAVWLPAAGPVSDPVRRPHAGWPADRGTAAG